VDSWQISKQAWAFVPPLSHGKSLCRYGVDIQGGEGPTRMKRLPGFGSGAPSCSSGSGAMYRIREEHRRWHTAHTPVEGTR